MVLYSGTWDALSQWCDRLLVMSSTRVEGSVAVFLAETAFARVIGGSMQRITRMDNHHGIQLTVSVEPTGSGWSSVVTIDGDRDVEQIREHDNPSRIADRIVRASRMTIEHVSTEYRQALLSGWAVTFSSPVGENGQLAILDRWLLKKLINRCPNFQTAWIPIAGSDRAVRILRSGDHAWVQIVDHDRPRQAQTLPLEHVTFSAVLEQIARVVNAPLGEYVIN